MGFSMTNMATQPTNGQLRPYRCLTRIRAIDRMSHALLSFRGAITLKSQSPRPQPPSLQPELLQQCQRPCRLSWPSCHESPQICRVIDVQPDPRQPHDDRLDPVRPGSYQMREVTIVAEAKGNRKRRRAQDRIRAKFVVGGHDGGRGGG